MFLYNRADGSEKYLHVCNAIFLLGVSYRLIRLVDYSRTVNCKYPQSIQFAVFFRITQAAFVFPFVSGKKIHSSISFLLVKNTSLVCNPKVYFSVEHQQKSTF